ncbi:hypothetical protein H8356DRAFT_1424219 [Neocallimastix lanati (nom. inval.)]|nr:hypothetical protein H8356DRAFT_1424219 [Neocallimastix sp. JGI-2020a]
MTYSTQFKNISELQGVELKVLKNKYHEKEINDNIKALQEVFQIDADKILEDRKKQVRNLDEISTIELHNGKIDNTLDGYRYNNQHLKFKRINNIKQTNYDVNYCDNNANINNTNILNVNHLNSNNEINPTAKQEELSIKMSNHEINPTAKQEELSIKINNEINPTAKQEELSIKK